MSFLSNSIVVNRSFSFSLEIIKIFQYLVNKKEFTLSKQLLRSGTSIGANANEAISAMSKPDFIRCLNISLKEARETSYWLNLLKDSNYINDEQFEVAHRQCVELIKILTSIIMTSKSNLAKTKTPKKLNS